MTNCFPLSFFNQNQFFRGAECLYQIKYCGRDAFQVHSAPAPLLPRPLLSLSLRCSTAAFTLSLSLPLHSARRGHLSFSHLQCVATHKSNRYAFYNVYGHITPSLIYRWMPPGTTAHSSRVLAPSHHSSFSCCSYRDSCCCYDAILFSFLALSALCFGLRMTGRNVRSLPLSCLQP